MKLMNIDRSARAFRGGRSKSRRRIDPTVLFEHLESRVMMSSSLPVFPAGPWTFDLEDRSSLYAGDAPLAPGAIKPDGAGGFFVDTAGAAGAINQKSIYVLKQLSTGTVRPVGADGMKDIVFQGATGESFLPGGSGISYGLDLGSIKSTGGFFPEAILNFKHDGTDYVDLVPSTAGALGKGGLSATGLATEAALFGGFVDFYYTPGNGVSFVLAAAAGGDAAFVPGGGASGASLGAGAAYGFPDFADKGAALPGDGDGAGTVLFARGVFTPLLAPDNQHPTQSAAIDADTVLFEQINVTSGTGFGFGFVNIIEAVPDFLADFEPDFFGPGRDLRVDFQTTFQRDPNTGAPINTDGFNIASTDPVQGFKPSFVAEPAINLVKLTNGTDNNSPTGPVVPVGSTVTWTYIVTNPGNVPLQNVVVVDDNGTPGVPGDDFNPTFVGGDTDADGLLDLTETWTYTASAIAVAGQYANFAVVTGEDANGTDVTDNDPDHYFAALPAINIVKLTNGTDNDSPTGPVVPVGSTVTWTYIVTNPGNVPLSNVVVVDDNGTPGVPGDDFSPTFVGGDADADELLDTTETWTYTASAIAVAGQYENFAVVTGTGPFGETVTDDNPDHYFGALPAINIVKLTNSTDNDSPTGPVVPVGSTVTWTYIVTNPGNVPLSNVVVVDDNGTPGVPGDDFSPTFVGGDTDADGLLDVSETWTYTAAAIAVAGQYANFAVVTGKGPFDETVTDDNPDHYFGALPDINIVKLTNGTDNDSPTGPIVPVGSTVTWSYIVTNTGNVPLSNVVVVDDNGTPGIPGDDFSPTFVGGDTDADGLLDLTETWTYTASGIAVAGQYKNFAVVTGKGPFGETVTDDNPDHYFGADANIDIEKYVKVLQEEEDHLHGRITGGGSFFRPLTAAEQAFVAAHNIDPDGLNLRVTHGFELHCDLRDPNNLEINWFDVVTGNEFSFHLTDLLTAECIDTELVQQPPKSSPFDTFIATGIGRVKQGNGPAVDGFTIEFTFVDGGPSRGEPGIDDTAQVVIKDGGGNTVLVVDFPSPLIHGNHQTHKDNQSTATGGGTLVDPDPGNPGADADTHADAIIVNAGDTIMFTYVVTNPGPVGIANVVVTDDNATPGDTSDDFNPAPILTAGFNVGDLDQDNILDVGEEWLYTATTVVIAGEFCNLGTVTGNSVLLPSQTVTDNDPACWTTQLEGPGIDIEKYVKTQDQPASGGEGLTPGFWKTHSEYGPAPLSGWPDTGYDPDDGYESIFGVSVPGAPSLLDALGTGGGGLSALLRHATAALLNAAHPNIDYGLNVAQVISLTQAAINSGDAAQIEALKDQFAALNEQGADLTSGGGGGGGGLGADADTPADAIVVNVGDVIIFTYVVTNPGSVGLSNVVVIDDNATPGIPADDFSPAPVLAGGFNVGDTDHDNILDIGEQWLYTATTVAVAGDFCNIATVTGKSVANPIQTAIDSDPACWTTQEVEPPLSSLSGYVYVDLDDDGVIDPTEPAIPGATVKLSGTDADGNAVSATTTTDANGYYEFTGLKAGTYKLTEVQPAGYLDGKDTLGSVGGTTANDVHSSIPLPAGIDGINYNFGERLVDTTVHSGQTATIGFWQNKNGQALIKALNGGQNSTALGHWLATNFPNMYGAQAGAANNLTGKTNTQVAAYYLTLFKMKGQKLEAQVMAVALASYVTDSDLAGNAAASYGFEVTASGLGGATWNVGSSGAAFGVANNTVLTVLQMLQATDSMTVLGNLYNGNSMLRNLANVVYTAINEAGDI